MIIVTGGHRFGTTWVGKVLSQAPNTQYVHEPFNLENNINFNKIDKWYYRPLRDIDRNNTKSYFLENLFINRIKTKYLIYKIVNSDIRNRLFKRHIVKDPHVLFYLDIISDYFDFDTILMMRNPFSFINSLLVQNWIFPITHLTQPSLIKFFTSTNNDALQNIEKACRSRSFIEASAYLWNTIVSEIDRFKELDHFYLIIHEELCTSPVEKFKGIFQKLNLHFDQRVNEYIIESTTSKNFVEGSPVYQYRDVTALNESWKDRLQQQQVTRIREITYPYLQKYYPSLA